MWLAPRVCSWTQQWAWALSGSAVRKVKQVYGRRRNPQTWAVTPPAGKRRSSFQQLAWWVIKARRMVGQWLELRAFTAMGLGLIPGWGTKIMQAVWHSTARKKKYQLTIFLDFVFCLLSVYSCINTTLFRFAYYSFIYILKLGSMMLLCSFLELFYLL